MPTIRDEILALAPDQRAAFKAQLLAENAAKHLPISWSLDQTRAKITVTAANFDGHDLILWVTARSEKEEWTKTDDLRFVNPPITVPTGQKISNFDPDLLIACIREIVGDTVRLWLGGAT
jgi:hypothetical protein